MSLQFILGNSGSGKSHELFERVIKESIEHPEQNFIVLVPEQFTLQTQKELVARHPRHGIMNIDILSFERLAFRVMEETGAGNPAILDDEGKNLVIRRIAGKEEESLKVLKGNLKKRGYISEVKSVISELTQYDISPENMDDMFKAADEGSYLQYKLQDIQKVYQAFETFLADKYITKEEILDILCRMISRSKIVKDSVVVLDGFTGFTPIQNKVLGELMKYCDRVIVTVTMDERENPYVLEDKFQLFALSKQMIISLTDLARRERIHIEDPICLYAYPVYRYRQHEAMAYLERYLFRTGKHSYEKEQSDIRIYCAEDPKEETECAAQRIRSLVRNRGYRYRDIAVVVSNMDVYGDEIEKIFQVYKIPVFMDYKRSILLNPFVEYVRSVLAMADKNFAQENVFRFLRTGLAGFTMDQVDRLENYVIALGIRGYKKWQEKWVRRGKNTSVEELEMLNHLRVTLVEKVDSLMFVLKQRRKTVRDITTALYEFLVQENLQSKITEQAELFAKEGELSLEREYSQVYKVMIELFDKFVSLLGDEYVSLQEYCDLLDAGMEEAKIGIIPPGLDEVMVGDIERTRLKDIKALIFMGVNDTLLPGDFGSGGLLSERDREKMLGQGIALAPGSREKTYIQKFYLYLHLTKPAETLDIMYSMVSNDGKSVRPAYLVNDIMKMFPKINVVYMENCRIEQKELVRETGLRYLAEGLRDNEKLRDAKWQELYRWYLSRGEFKNIVERLVEVSMYRKPKDRLTLETAKELYGNMDPSISRMEKFVSCACAHFLRYGLRLEEREEYEFAALDFGNVFHSALERYAKKLEEHDKGWLDVTEEEQERFIDEAVEESIVDYKNTVLYSSARDSYMIPRMKRMMRRTIWALNRQLGRGKFKPSGYEVGFKSGKIDRIDTYETDDKVYVKIIDYKTGSKSFDMAAFYHGLQMQLVVYMGEAIRLEKRKHPGKSVVPAGIFYYKMKDPIVAREADEEKLEEAILKELRLDGFVNSDENVIYNLDKEFTGSSGVIPVQKTKNGFSKASKVLSEEEFEAVLDYAVIKREQLKYKMQAGNTDPKPYQMGQQTGCDYCPYHDICGFDDTIAGYEYHEMKDFSKDEVMEKIFEERQKGEEKDGDEMDGRTAESN